MLWLKSVCFKAKRNINYIINRLGILHYSNSHTKLAIVTILWPCHWKKWWQKVFHHRLIAYIQYMSMLLYLTQNADLKSIKNTERPSVMTTSEKLKHSEFFNQSAFATIYLSHKIIIIFLFYNWCLCCYFWWNWICLCRFVIILGKYFFHYFLPCNFTSDHQDRIQVSWKRFQVTKFVWCYCPTLNLDFICSFTVIRLKMLSHFGSIFIAMTSMITTST